MTVLLEDLPQSQRERMAYIELRVFFVGELRRADLEARFSIKPAAATRDLNAYRALVPGNLVYDASQKAYRPGVQFQPLFGFAADRVLAWLLGGFGDGLDLKLKKTIPSDTALSLVNIDFGLLAALTRAIHAGKVAEVEYLSLSSGASSRQIVPLALADNGHRWHLRAFDRLRQRFADFVLTRITRVGLLDEVAVAGETLLADEQWNRLLPLRLLPHPDLAHPEAITLDYAMHQGELNLMVRAAMAGYTLSRWRVDCSADHRLDATMHHLWLANRDALAGVESALLAPGYDAA